MARRSKLGASSPPSLLDKVVNSFFEEKVEEANKVVNSLQEELASKTTEIINLEEEIDRLTKAMAAYADATKRKIEASKTANTLPTIILDDSHSLTETNLANGLKPSELAQRLGVKPNGNEWKRGTKSGFSEWTKSKDPDGLSWNFDRQHQKYFPE